jgi:single-strand DNA-binding protein
MTTMTAANITTLTGRITRNPELRTTATGQSVTTLGIAVRRGDKDEHGQYRADFFDVTVWDGLARTCAKHLRTGRLVSVLGGLVPQRWETRDGSPRRSLEVVAADVQFLDAPSREAPEASEHVGV